MRRLLWLGVGLAVGALVVRQVSKAVRAYSPAGLADSATNAAAGLWGSVQDFISDVREGMAEREEQIREAFARGESLAELDAAESGDIDEWDYLDDEGSYPTR